MNSFINLIDKRSRYDRSCSFWWNFGDADSSGGSSGGTAHIHADCCNSCCRGHLGSLHESSQSSGHDKSYVYYNVIGNVSPKSSMH